MRVASLLVLGLHALAFPLAKQNEARDELVFPFIAHACSERFTAMSRNRDMGDVE